MGIKDFLHSTLNMLKDNLSLYTISIFPLPTEKGMELLHDVLNTFFSEALTNSYEEHNCVNYVDIKRSIKIKVFDQTKYL